MRKLFISLFLAFILQMPLQSKPIILGENINNYELWNHVEIFVDKTGKLSCDQLSGVTWDKNTRKMIQYGLSGNAYWFKFTINNSLQKTDDFYLDTNDTQTEILELYQQNNTGCDLLRKAGRFYPESFKRWNKPEVLLSPPKGITTYYLKAQSQSYITFELVLRTPLDYLTKISNYLVYYGSYFSIIIVMILYNLLLFLGLRSKVYAWYVIYLISILAHQIVGEGFGILFFHINYHPIFSAITFLAAVLFTSAFFENRKNHPILNKASIFLFGFLFLWGIISLLIDPKWYAYFITTSIVAPIVYTFVIINCIAALKSGNRSAKFFILGWSGLIFFSSMYLAVIQEILPANIITLNGIAIGSVYEAIVLSLALAQQINTSRKEKEEADKKSIEKQKQMTESFARFVPTEFLQFLERKSILDVVLGDQVQRYITILFSDIRSFTTLSEKSTPQETIDFLNSYLTSIGPIIRKHNGFIDKYIGDAIMAIFPHGVDDAIQCAVDMMQQLSEFNKTRTLSAMEQINIGVGIHGGECMLGTIGENNRLETTVISDAVNTASRLESLNKELHTNILISHETLLQSKNIHQYEYRELGEKKIRGKNKTIQIDEIISHSL